MFTVVLLALLTGNGQSSQIDLEWIMQVVPLSWPAFDCIFRCVFDNPTICSVTGFTVEGAAQACPCHPAIGGQHYMNNQKQIDCSRDSGWLDIWDKTKGMYDESYCGLSLDSFPQTKYQVNPLAFFGHNKKKKGNRASKIEQGRKAKPLQFPWALRVNKVYQRLIYRNNGMAVLIHPRFALTAAHVALMARNLPQGHEVIFSGGDVLWALNEDEGRWSDAESITVHPTWDEIWSGRRPKNDCLYDMRVSGCIDLAVVKLSREIANTNPACLPEIDTKHTRRMRLAGWGRTNPLQSKADAHHEGNLQWTDLKWNSECYENFVCSSSSTKGSLPGDSGSGWMVRDEQPRSDKTQRWTVFGVTYGIDADWRTRLFMDVRKYKDWICQVAPEVCRKDTGEKISFD